MSRRASTNRTPAVWRVWDGNREFVRSCPSMLAAKGAAHRSAARAWQKFYIGRGVPELEALIAPKGVRTIWLEVGGG